MNNECDLRNFWKKSRQRGAGSVKSSLESFSRPKGLDTGLNDTERRHAAHSSLTGLLRETPFSRPKGLDTGLNSRHHTFFRDLKAWARD